MIEFKMPSLGADMEDGILRQWRKKVGDVVKHGDIIADVETQKGLIEIEVFDEGKIESLLIKKDQKVPVGTVMALINPQINRQLTVLTKVKSNGELKIKKALAEPPKKVKISPLAKQIAEDNKIDISVLKGSGEDGAITKADVESVLANKEVTKENIFQANSIRQAIAAAMSKSNNEIPHYYLECKVDMSFTLRWLKDTNGKRPLSERILPVAVIIKAVAKALIEVPGLNGIWDKGFQQKKQINIGLVVSLREGGIIVPAIHDSDKKNESQLMAELNDLIPRARAMKLRSSELADSTITVTNLGDNSAETVFGVIYPPQVALIGIGSIHEEPFAENGMLTVRPVMNITLAADHRASDGHTGSKFLMILKKYLLNPDKL